MYSKEIQDVESSNNKGYIYLFKILIQKDSFKFGHTTRNIRDRLCNYKDYIFDIYYVNVSLIKEREFLIKRYLLNDKLFKCVKGYEYFSGPFEKVLEIFNYISTLDDSSILYYINNKNILIDVTKIEKQLEEVEEKTIININNKIEVEDKIENESSKIFKSDEFNCTYCNEIFREQRNLEKHFLICKVKIEREACKNKIEKIIKEKDKKYKNKIEEFELIIKEKDQTYKNKIEEFELIIKEKDKIHKNSIENFDKKEIKHVNQILDLRSEFNKLEEKLKKEIYTNKKLECKIKCLYDKLDRLLLL
jgi:hypothetical protein